MKSISTVFVLFSFALVSADALLADESKFEASRGETVTLSFTMEKAEEADRLRITFTSESAKSLIAQSCDPSDGCAVVNTPGVSLMAGKGRVCVTLEKVNSSRSGIYEARAFFGKDVYEVKATLVVHEASFPSTIAPPHSSTLKPLNSDLLWLCAVVPLVISGGVCFWKRRKGVRSGVCPSVSRCLSALWRRMSSFCPSDGSVCIEMDGQSEDVPLSVEETRAEPAQSSVRPWSFTQEGEECNDDDDDDEEEWL